MTPPIDQTTLVFWTLTTGIFSALATGLGAIPVHFLRNSSRFIRSFSSAVAAGMMISASVFSLAQEGISLKARFPWAPYLVIAGLLLGAGFFWWTERRFSGENVDIAFMGKGAGNRRGMLILLSMFIHSIPEGIAIGVGFATGNFQFGLIMALAISVHNIPEGISISLPLKSDGASTLRCAMLSILSSLPQPVMAVPAALLTWLFLPVLPVGLGFAGGAMIYLVISELIPDALEDGSHAITAWGVMIGLSFMLLITNLLNLIPLPE